MSNQKLMQELAPKSKLSSFKEVLEKNKNQLMTALPKHMNADRMIRLACTEFSKNENLQNCDQKSVFGAIIQAAQLGLEIGVLGQAYLIPYNNKCQFIPGYKGLIALARRSGELSSIETHIVYDNDMFDLTLGINTEVTHKPFLGGNRGEPKLVYGVAKFKDGGYHFEWMTIAEVNKIRQSSKSASIKYSPWFTHYDQMVRKTIIRRMMNYLPMSTEMQNAMQISDAVDDGKMAYIDSGVVVTSDFYEKEINDENSSYSEEVDIIK